MKLKKLVSGFSALALALTTLGVNVYAVDPVAQIGDVKYTTLETAIAAAKTGDTIQLQNDINYGEFIDVAIQIPSDKKFTLDLAGHTIEGIATNSSYSSLIYINKGADVTIKDSGSNGQIVYSSTNPDPKWGYGTYTIDVPGTLTLDSGSVINNTVNGASYAVDVDCNCSDSDAIFNMNGGVLDCPRGDMTVRLYANDGSDNTQKSIMNMTDGIIKSNGIWTNDQRKGSPIELNISGGTVEGFLDFISNNDKTVVNITGGIFNVPKIRFREPGSDVPNTKPYVNISGGTWNFTDNVVYDIQATDKTKLVSITGGTFNINPSSLDYKKDGSEILNFVATGYVATDNGDGTWTVNKASSAVAKIGDTEYATLEAAFAALEDNGGETIELLSNCSGNGIVVPTGKNFTVDFGGFTYTLDGTTVGSTGTETNGFQLLKDSTIIFKNGRITSDKAKILIQNYSNLTLDNMTIDGTKLVGDTVYTLSTNNGNTIIKDTTISAKTNGYAFDVCTFSNYTGNTVTVKGDSIINGNIGISSWGDNTAPIALIINDGKFTGSIELLSGHEPKENQLSVQISGGIFSVSPNENYLVSGCESIDNDDTKTQSDYPYAIDVETPVATDANNKKYVNVEIALEDSKDDNKVVTIAKDVKTTLTDATDYVGATVKLETGAKLISDLVLLKQTATDTYKIVESTNGAVGHYIQQLSNSMYTSIDIKENVSISSVTVDESTTTNAAQFKLTNSSGKYKNLFVTGLPNTDGANVILGIIISNINDNETVTVEQVTN